MKSKLFQSALIKSSDESLSENQKKAMDLVRNTSQRSQEFKSLKYIFKDNGYYFEDARFAKRDMLQALEHDEDLAVSILRGY